LQFFNFFAQLGASKIMNKMRKQFFRTLFMQDCDTSAEALAVMSVACLMLNDFQNFFTVGLFFCYQSPE
jgi:hypothetical protein